MLPKCSRKEQFSCAIASGIKQPCMRSRSTISISIPYRRATEIKPCFMFHALIVRNSSGGSFYCIAPDTFIQELHFQASLFHGQPNAMKGMNDNVCRSLS